MSTCLFTKKVTDLSTEEIISLSKKLIKFLAETNNPKPGFEADQYSGRMATLSNCFLELEKRIWRGYRGDRSCSQCGQKIKSEDQIKINPAPPVDDAEDL
jgi:hypothetical protein